MFEKFNFSFEQIKKFHQAASRDFGIIELKSAPEIIFVICYQIIIITILEWQLENRIIKPL